MKPCPIICACLALSACLGGEPETPTTPTPTVTGVEVPLQEGPTIAFDVGVDAIYCAAAVRCEPALLSDPFTGRPATTLVLAYTCRAEDGSAAALDVFQAVSRKMTCYDEGDPDDPATWDAGEEVVPLREEVYAGLVNPWGDAQYNLAILPLDALGHRFCRVEAWGVFTGTEITDDDRTVTHASQAPVTHWEVFIEGTSPNDMDCHLEDGDVSHLDVGNAAAMTHTLPSPRAAGQYPRTQSSAMVLGATLTMDVGGVASRVHGLRVAYTIDASFPMAAHAGAASFMTRDLWFAADQTGLPLDIAAGRSCVSLDGDGKLETVALEVLDWWTRTPLGAVVLHDAPDAPAGERFAYEPEVGTSACHLIAPDDIVIEAPCLVAGP